jgi:hypothetical protein
MRSLVKRGSLLCSFSSCRHSRQSLDKASDILIVAYEKPSKDHVVAEPLYIMLALKGYQNAYDTVMSLSRESRRTQTKLTELAWQHSELRPYLERLSDEHKRILDDPVLYTGDAVRRTLATCDFWALESDRIKRMLEAERSDQQRGDETWWRADRALASGA